MHIGENLMRYEATMRQCRALERRVAALRGELLWMVEGEGDRQRVQRALGGLREQLRLAEALADDFEDARNAA